MQKTISIIRGNKGETYELFHQGIVTLIDEIKSQGTARIHYTITMERPPSFSLIPYRKEKIAMISVHDEDNDYLNILKKAKGFAGSFMVTEALPVAYQKDWKDGAPTPGVCLLTLFRQKKGIEYDSFIDRWHNGHTPLTLKIHPIYHYNRNVVDKGLGEPPVWYDGIVEEHCRTRKELMNPFKFFGPPWNMIKVFFDVKTFIDYKSIETYLVSEFWVKS